MKKSKNAAMHNIRLVLLEHALTEGTLCISIMTPFYLSIGMSYAEVTLSQAIFTVAVILLDIPMGYLADCFSRKWANIIGDFSHALAFMYYATATNFTSVVLAEIGCGVACSLSSGVDVTLLRHFAKKAKKDERACKRLHAKMVFYGNAVAIVLTLLGGPIGAINFRLAMFMSAIPSLIAGIFSLFIEDDSERLKTNRGKLLLSMIGVTKESFKNSKLRLRIFAYAIIREMSHPIIWILTPILMEAGIPLQIVSFAWVIDSIMRLLGNKLAEKFSGRLNPFKIALFPVLALSNTLLVFSVSISMFTVWAYAFSGIACGWTGATLMPLIQEQTPPAKQTTTLSLAKTLGNLLYVPVISLMGIASDVSLNLGCGIMAIIFIPLSAVIVINFRRR